MEIDFAEVKPSVLNWVIVGLMAATFIVFGKWVFTRYPIRGVSDFFNAL